MMKRNVLLLALAVSVLFNVFFAVGYLKAKAEAARVLEQEHAVTARVVEELKLDDAQAEVYSDLRQATTEDESVFHQSAVLVQQELVEELGNPDPDIDRLRSIVARRAELQRDRQVAAAERLGEFFHVLTPEQQRELLRRLHSESREAERMRRLLERFDQDDDGVLDEEERAAAEEYLQRRHREREERRLDHRKRREEAMQRFDADGDGELDEAEREAMRQWWRESGGWKWGRRDRDRGRDGRGRDSYRGRDRDREPERAEDEEPSPPQGT